MILSGWLSKKHKIQRCIFCYHKVGTVLLSKIFTEVCEQNHWTLSILMGKQEEIPDDVDIVLYGHSLIDLGGIKKPYTGVHLIRDPRDIIASGYLYHKRTDEEWCINENCSVEEPIRYPNVPFSQQHKAEDWKLEYIKTLGGKSYQQNLIDLSIEDGIVFEMMHYGKWTIESIREWDYDNNHVMEIRFEDVMENIDMEFDRIFKKLRFTNRQINRAMNIVRKHDLHRKTDEEIVRLDHVSSRNTRRWKGYFTQKHKEIFKKEFGDALVALGYEKDNDW